MAQTAFTLPASLDEDQRREVADGVERGEAGIRG